MELLHNAVRPYAWGSHTAIAALQGRAMPTEKPEAELWMGAHPAAPSTLDDGRTLVELVESDPAGALGASNVERFGPRLPFLLKVLAAEAPLSIQAHPDAAQARAGFEAEEREEIPRDATVRNYGDPYHKPELLCAVSDFACLCGFRDPADSARLLSRLDVPQLGPVVDLLRQDDPAQALREAVTTIMTIPENRRAELLDATVVEAGRLAAGDSAAAATYSMAADLGKRYPGDIGVVMALLLNHVVLRPGEAIYMPAGNPHAYLRGVGVELMAASDNVLRGGLTGKHVDVPELLRVLRYEVLDEPRFAPVDTVPGVVEWPTPMPDFRLSRVRVGGAAEEPVRLTANGPRIILCWSGQLRLDDGVAPVTLMPGQAAFAGAGAGVVEASGFGEAYQATTG